MQRPSLSKNLLCVFVLSGVDKVRKVIASR